jgi:hypothetical protein
VQVPGASGDRRSLRRSRGVEDTHDLPAFAGCGYLGQKNKCGRLWIAHKRRKVGPSGNLASLAQRICMTTRLAQLTADILRRGPESDHRCNGLVVGIRRTVGKPSRDKGEGQDGKKHHPVKLQDDGQHGPE